MGNGQVPSVQTGRSREEMGCVSAGGFAARKTAKPPIPAMSRTAAMVAIRLLMIALPAAAVLRDGATFIGHEIFRSRGKGRHLASPVPRGRSRSPPTGVL